MKTFQLKKPNDFHAHLRQGQLLTDVLPFHMMQCRTAIAMPNTDPPILTAKDVDLYEQAIELEIERWHGNAIRIDSMGVKQIIEPKESTFRPLMTFKITDATTVDMIEELATTNAIAGKLYPEGVTTNSEDGVTNIEELYPVLDAMQHFKLVLCLHGEMPGVTSLSREDAFLQTLCNIAFKFPHLKIVLEHITTANAVRMVNNLPGNVAATITLHHLLLTIDDILGGSLDPHSFCKPIAKTAADRESLQNAAFHSRNSKFFFGSDSAPHRIEKKECCSGAAGIWSAPVMLPLLCQLFHDVNREEGLENFVTNYGRNFYGIEDSPETIDLVESPWVVPKEIGGIRPFYAGKEIKWRVV